MKTPETKATIIEDLELEALVWADYKRVDERATGLDGHAVRKREGSMRAIDKLLDKLGVVMLHEIPVEGEPKKEAVVTFYSDPVDVGK